MDPDPNLTPDPTLFFSDFKSRISDPDPGSGLDPYSIEPVDPDPESGSRRAKMTHKSRKNV
jgi:hypothetical protein